MINAYERGVDDGFFSGTEADYLEGLPDEQRIAYKRGYDHGVWMYCQTLQEETE